LRPATPQPARFRPNTFCERARVRGVPRSSSTLRAIRPRRSSWALFASTLRSCSLLLYDLASVITRDDLLIIILISVNEAIGAILLQVGATNMIKVATFRTANTAAKFAVISTSLRDYLEVSTTVLPSPRGRWC
jgi:hypothetical protein